MPRPGVSPPTRTLSCEASPQGESSHPLRIRVRRRRELGRVDELELAARALVEALWMQAHDLGRPRADAELHAVAGLQLAGALAVALEQQRRRTLEHVDAQRLLG